MPKTILIVDDEKHTREGLMLALEDKYDIYLAANADEAFNLLDLEKFDVVLTDLRMTGKSGLKVIDKAISMPNKPITIMMTAYGSVETAVEAMKHGAYDFLTKPINLEKLDILITRSLNTRKLVTENNILHERLDKKYNLDGLIGNSKSLIDVIEKVKLVAQSKATVLLTGETGTGKELIAQAIHQNSDRARNAFIITHCAALPSNLLESELFGHEKGAFTGAMEKRIGRFEASNNGSLFLDEIGEIDASTQVKLLRFLEGQTFERIGSNKQISVDVRLIVATNRNLEEMVSDGKFREDLFYRLNVITLEIPPLRERKEDIPMLLGHYINYFGKVNKIKPGGLNSRVVNILKDYYWPGNIRELKNFCENIIVLNREKEISEYDLDKKFISNLTEINDNKLLDNPLSVEENEKNLIKNALIEVEGNRTKASKLLGISRRTLHRKILKWPELEKI